MHDEAETQGSVEALAEHDSHDIESSVLTQKYPKEFYQIFNMSAHCGMSRASGCSADCFLCILPTP